MLLRRVKKLQKEKQRKESALLLPGETRWGLATKCLHSLLPTKNCLQCASIDDTSSQIIPLNMWKQILNNDVFWVQGVFNLLLPVSLAVQKREGDTASLSNIPEIFKQLNENLIELLPSSPLSKKEE